MAKNSQNTVEQVETRSDPIEVTPDMTPHLAAAWDGVYHIFGGRADWEITPDGLVAHNFTVNARYNPETILRDISHRERRVPLFPTVFWITGIDPEQFTDSKEITAWMVQFYKGSVEQGSSRAPKYVRDAVAAYKARVGMEGTRRGPKPKNISLKNLSKLDPSVLREVPASEIAHLISVAEQALQSQATAQVSNS